MKVERKADCAVSEASCKEATGRTIADWFKALDKRGGIPLGRRELSKWLEHEHGLTTWARRIGITHRIANGVFQPLA